MNTKRIVMKFGGTSLRDGAKVQAAALLVKRFAKTHRSIVVASAMGQATDRLLEAAEDASKGKRTQVETFIREFAEFHHKAAQEAIRSDTIRNKIEKALTQEIEQLAKVLTGVALLGELTPRSLDYILSFGERFSSHLLWGALVDNDVHAERHTGGEAGIITDSHFGEAHPLMQATRSAVQRKLAPLLEQSTIPVVTGFIAADQDGYTTTLGRGGSDYTASILASALTCDEVWIWTDVDGLLTADPRIVKDAHVLREVAFAEAVEMALFGVKAMHPRALEPAMEAGIPVRIRNTFRPQHTGTLITPSGKSKPGRVVKSVALVGDVAMITVHGVSMVGAPGTAAKVFDALGQRGVNVMMISQSVSEANISLVVRRRALENAVAALETALLGGGIVKQVESQRDVAVVAVVGAGMKGTPGVAARVFSAVAEKGVNIKMIAQGSSELNISFVVAEADGARAVHAIHDAFRLSHT